MINLWGAWVIPLLVFTSSATGRPAQGPPPRLAEDDRIRLAETRRVAAIIQDSVWPGWSQAPFPVLLVTDSLEFLLWHPRPDPDFRSIGHDSLLASEVFARPRSQPTNLLATFPAVGGVPTIVVGQPARTGKNSTAWVLTLLHEHFHQHQMARPGYYAAVDSLQLARGDRTGMWMLNFPFPYDSAPIQRRFRALSQALFAASAAGPAGPSPELSQRYASARRELRSGLGAEDARYLDFQFWQEGVARYVEYAAARLASRAAPPAEAFRRLPDFVPYADLASAMHEKLLRELQALDLGASRRVSFYPVGAAIALLLDQTTPDWKERYFMPMFRLHPD